MTDRCDQKFVREPVYKVVGTDWYGTPVRELVGEKAVPTHRCYHCNRPVFPIPEPVGFEPPICPARSPCPPSAPA